MAPLPSVDLTNHGPCSPVIFTAKKHLCASGPMQLTPVLFKGQLYILFYCFFSLACFILHLNNVIVFSPPKNLKIFLVLPLVSLLLLHCRNKTQPRLSILDPFANENVSCSITYSWATPGCPLEITGTHGWRWVFLSCQQSARGVIGPHSTHPGI